MQKVIPSHGWLLAKPVKKETQRESGFLLSDRSAEAPKMAEVVATTTTGYEEGDVIIYKPYAMTEVKLNGEEHYLIEKVDILGKVIDA
jgi:co-chaperonin GroES (HSP10)